MFFDKKIALFQSEAESKEEILRCLSEALMKKNMVREGFYAAVLKREKEFPTGLPTTPIGVAIPHTEAEFVKEPQIAFASLKEPVFFQIMGDSRRKVAVSLIFMLALDKAEDQLGMLQKLIDVFQQDYLISELKACQNIEEYQKILNQADLI